MGNKGRPVSASRPQGVGGALRSAGASFGVTSTGRIKSMTRRRTHRKQGYRMPAIVREQIRANMEFQRTIATALLLKAGGH